jgi:site-specific recombinase XerC
LLRELRNAVQLAEMKTSQAIFRARRDAAIVALMLHAGLRLAEAAHLALGDVELNERKGKVVVRRGKARKYREVPLNLDARKALEAYLEVRPESEDTHLFLSQKGGALSSRAIQDRIAVYACKAGLEDVTAHTLRHSFAHNLVDAGVSLDRVAVLLGHESLDTTARYTRPEERDLAEAVSRVEWE